MYRKGLLKHLVVTFSNKKMVYLINGMLLLLHKRQLFKNFEVF